MNFVSRVPTLFIGTNINLYHQQHCKSLLPNATDSQEFFLFHVFGLQAQYYQAHNMTNGSIFINNLSYSATKHPYILLVTFLHP